MTITAFQTRKTSKGRHPLLKVGTTTHQLYYHLKTHPGATVPEMAELFGLPYYTVKSNVTKLKNQGLVRDQGPKRIGPNNRPAACLEVIPQNESGYARDNVKVQVTILVNEFGEYSALAKIKGQMPTALEDNPVAIHSFEQTVSVPKPNEYKPRPVQTSASEDSLVIEGEIVSNSRDQ